MELQVNTTLQNGKYTIIKKLGSGGFGITYLATQKVFVTGGLGTIDAEVKVSIKEFFMKDFCNREVTSAMVTVPSKSVSDLVEKYRQKFVKEADKISKLKHPNIVKVLDYFDENGTSYYVMEYIEGGSLADKVRKNGLPEQLATRYILQVADALNYIHQKRITHLDIKPSNIMLSKDDNAILIDFGLSKQYDKSSGVETSITQPGVSEGYAPIEQYMPGGVSKFSPETDIYSLGATFFKLLTGLTPPKAFDIADNGVPVEELKNRGVSENIIKVISKAMESRKKDRMDTFTFIYVLKNVDNSLLDKKFLTERAAFLHINSSDRKFTRVSQKRFPEGFYNGEIENEEPNGKGVFNFNDGRIYDGEWRNGIMEGCGNMVWPSGKKYKGEWVDGEFHGYGELTYANGKVYKGNFIEGKRNGKGILVNFDGEIFEGEFDNDIITTRGVYYYRDKNGNISHLRNAKSNSFWKKIKRKIGLFT